MAQAQDEGGREPAPGLLGRAYDGLGYLGGLVLAVMTVAVFVQVVARYFGITLVDGLEEIPRYLFIWLVVLGSAAAMYRKEHTLVDYFVKKFGPRTQVVILIVTTLASIAVFVWLIKLSIVLVPNAQLQTSAGLSLPLGYVFAAIPVGAVLIIVPMVVNLVRGVRELWPKRS
jgi:TRAP-type C4-dicarboxylate transport system permease small subunit